MMGGLLVFCGTGCRSIGEETCSYLGVEPGRLVVRRFANGETYVEIRESVRGKDTFVIQSTCNPANDNLMELLITIDALRRASSTSITAVIPYYGYARQDAKVQPRSPITAKLVADLLTAAGVDRVVAVDFHSGQVQGFFDIPVDHLFAAPVFIKHIHTHFGDSPVIVSPDAGGVERARLVAKPLGLELAVTDIRWEGPDREVTAQVIGDVKDRVAILIDDMVDTGNTICNAAALLAEKGAKSVVAYCTHAVLSGEAIAHILSSPIEQVVVTNTIPLSREGEECPKILVLSLAELLGEAIQRIYNMDSVSSLFVPSL